MVTRTLPALCCAGLLCTTAAFAADTTQACKSTVSGDLRLHTLYSKVFGNSRAIRVLLPPGYDAPGNRSHRYPVLYLLDVQNLFDACLSDVSHHEWGVDETVQALVAAKKVPPLIVVGVDHAGKYRGHEYLPYRDFLGDPEMDEPAGQRFPEFLTREVMPLVDGEYRTLPGQPNTGIGGSSYGGVAALYALLARPLTAGVRGRRRQGNRRSGDQRPDGDTGPRGRGQFPHCRLRRREIPRRHPAGVAAQRDRLGSTPTRRAHIPVRRMAGNGPAAGTLTWVADT